VPGEHQEVGLGLLAVNEVQEHLRAGGGRLCKEEQVRLLAVLVTYRVPRELILEHRQRVLPGCLPLLVKSPDFGVGQVSLRLVAAAKVLVIDHVGRHRTGRYADNHVTQGPVLRCADRAAQHRERRVSNRACHHLDALRKAG